MGLNTSTLAIASGPFMMIGIKDSTNFYKILLYIAIVIVYDYNNNDDYDDDDDNDVVTDDG